MVLDPTQLLTATNLATQGLHSVGPAALAYIALVAALCAVAVLGNGTRAKRAHAVLKLLLRAGKDRSKRDD